METRIPTKPIKVSITTDDYEIQGYLHVKVGAYHARISDLLNTRDSKFIPITDAVYLSVNTPDATPAHAETMIVRIDSIKAVVPDPETEKKAIEDTRAETDSNNPNVSPQGWG